MTQIHTPGPWKLDIIEDCKPDATAYAVCDIACDRLVASTGFCKPAGEREANARLIAAAPELLEALENLAEHIDSKSGDFAMRAHFLKEAFAAIAKARGQA